MSFRPWPRDWVSPRFAWSCLSIQLQACREISTMYLSDDASPEELLEMAAEQRAIRRQQQPAPGFGYQTREVTLRPAPGTASTLVLGVMLSLVLTVMAVVMLLTQLH